MGTITALTAQKRTQDRVNVYLDGQFAFGLATAVAVGLKVGQSLSPEQIASLQQQDSFEKGKRNAIRLISYRPRSVAEVQRNLRDKAFDESVIKQVVEHLHHVELLDDEAFARYWVEQRETFKPRGRIALQQELQQKGVSRAMIDAILTDLDETAAARRAAVKPARRWANLPQETFRIKLGRYLQRRGFSYEIIEQVTNEMWETTPIDRENIT